MVSGQNGEEVIEDAWLFLSSAKSVLRKVFCRWVKLSSARRNPPYRRGTGFLDRLSGGLLQGAGRGVVAQAEEVANGGEDGVGMVVMRFGHGRADGGAGVVEELILEPHRHVGYGLAVGFAQVGVGGEEGGQLALAELIGVVAKLLQQGAGGLLMAHQGAAGGGLAFDDQKGWIDALLPPQAVLIGLGTQDNSVSVHHYCFPCIKSVSWIHGKTSKTDRR